MEQAKAVVAIDFGSSRSGYAFSLNDPDNIICNKFEGEDTPQKICTCILLQGTPAKFEFKSFGNEAYHKLAILDTTNDDFHGFKYFKMKLYAELSVVESQTGAKFPLIEVISQYIKGISHAAMDQLNRSTTIGNLFMDQVQWIITVPAIWNNAAKQLMRLAAQKAGLPDSLLLALEPEAAALCCRYNRRELHFDPGTKYMVVDCGGGTVDIAMHEIDDTVSTHEIHTPDGGRWGSIRVDENFEQLLCEICGDDIRQDRVGLAEVMEFFEQEKLRFTPNQQYDVAIFLPDFQPVRLAEYNQRHKTNVRFERRKLLLPPIIMSSLFRDPIDSIVACIKSLLRSIEPVELNYIFLVGGFANSTILQDRIMNEFQTPCTKVIVANNPGMTVVQGAVHFGLDASAISSRYSKFTYGVEGMRYFLLGVDPVENLVMVDGVGHCSKTFRPFVKANQSVKLDEKVVEHFAPVRRRQTRVLIPIYETPAVDLKYITPEMQEIGTLCLNIPEDEDTNKSNIKVTFKFGGTEIKARAKHIVTKEKIACNLQFQFTRKQADQI